jgi:hypothetical protein
VEETVDSKNPIVLSPQTRSSVIIPTQHEILRTIGEMGGPNTLFDLITIYDDEDISKVSL